MTNPYRLPNDPRVTIREVLAWVARRKDATLWQVAGEFDITNNDASVRLRKLHRWGYLRRYKPAGVPRLYHYSVTAFGRKAVRRWAAEG